MRETGIQEALGNLQEISKGKIRAAIRVPLPTGAILYSIFESYFPCPPGFLIIPF